MKLKLITEKNSGIVIYPCNTAPPKEMNNRFIVLLIKFMYLQFNISLNNLFWKSYRIILFVKNKPAIYTKLLKIYKDMEIYFANLKIKYF